LRLQIKIIMDSDINKKPHPDSSKWGFS